MGPLKASAFEMKCSRTKAPMGTTPLRECKRRNRKEVPCPARSGATPDLTLGATGLAVDATITAPCVDQCRKPIIIEAHAKVSQGDGAPGRPPAVGAAIELVTVWRN